MLSLDEIEKFYGDKERSFKRNILREYFQYRLLEMIFNSPSASKMSFLGGTALRIIHGNPRFSEDLDFDNFSLSADEFAELGPLVEKKFRAEGYEAEFRNVFKQTYRCYIKIPRVLFENGVSPLSNEKLMIQIDTQPHGFQYKRESVVLNKFGIITEIFVTPIDILLSQKIRAAMERKRPQGRDFFDIVFLLSRTKPNYDYLREKMGIKDKADLKKRLLDRASTLDFDALAADVGPFLYEGGDADRIRLFPKYIDQVEL